MIRTLSYTVRGMIRTPGVTLAMILTLALGIGTNLAAFGVINGVLLHPLPFPQSNRIMAVWRTTWINGVFYNTDPVSLYDAFVMRSRSTTFASLAPYQTWDGIVAPDRRPQHLDGARVGAQFLDVLGIRPALGRGFTPADERNGAPPVAMVSYAFWAGSLHKDVSAVGRTVLVNGRPVQIAGVLPPDFFFPNFTRLVDEHPSILFVLQHTPGLSPGNNGMGMIGRLKDGVSVDRGSADLNRIMESLNKQMAVAMHVPYKPGGRNDAMRILPLADDMFGPTRLLLFPVLGSVFIVLLHRLFECRESAHCACHRPAARTCHAASRRRDTTPRVWPNCCGKLRSGDRCGRLLEWPSRDTRSTHMSLWDRRDCIAPIKSRSIGMFSLMP